jgi:hypothetical protein
VEDEDEPAPEDEGPTEDEPAPAPEAPKTRELTPNEKRIVDAFKKLDEKEKREQERKRKKKPKKVRKITPKEIRLNVSSPGELALNIDDDTITYSFRLTRKELSVLRDQIDHALGVDESSEPDELPEPSVSGGLSQLTGPTARPECCRRDNRPDVYGFAT